MKRMKLWPKIRVHWEILFLITFFIVVYALWSINRHLHFQTDAVDLGIFDQALWHYSHFEAPMSTVKFGTTPGANLLGDHFHPILVFLAPIYWIWKDVSGILVAQALAVGIAAWPLYQLAVNRFKKKYFGLAIAFAYLTFIGVQTLIDYEFHEIAFGLPLFAFAILFLHDKRIKLYFLMIGLSLLVKEDMPLYVAMLGVYGVIRLRLYKIGLITVGVGLASYFIITSYIIPFFKKDIFAYEHLPPEIGKTGLDLVVKSITNPFLVAKAAFYDDHLIKIKTTFNLIGSFAFLPLLSPETLVLTFPNIAERFLTTLIQRWIIRFQYSAILGVIFAIATINAISNLLWVSRKLKIKDKVSSYLLPVVSIVLIISPLYFTYRNNGPLTRIINPKSYELSQDLKKNYEVLKMIPSDVSVGAQSSWVPHLSQRKEIYSFEPSLLGRQSPDYLVLTNLETSDSFYKYEALESFKKEIRSLGTYEVLVDDGVRLLAKKKGLK